MCLLCTFLFAYFVHCYSMCLHCTSRCAYFVLNNKCAYYALYYVLTLYLTMCLFCTLLCAYFSLYYMLSMYSTVSLLCTLPCAYFVLYYVLTMYFTMYLLLYFAMILLVLWHVCGRGILEAERGRREHEVKDDSSVCRLVRVRPEKRLPAITRPIEPLEEQWTIQESMRVI